MIIENGAELSIAANYTCNANIIIKNGKIKRSGSGKLTFNNGFKLIVEGEAEITGTGQNKLEIDFSNPLSNNGILVDSMAYLNIANCIITNAEVGLSTQPYFEHLDIDSVNFEDCDYSIYVSGPCAGDDVPVIRNTSIENSEYGILGSNLSSIIIRDNTVTDTESGINLSNVTGVMLFGNDITSSMMSMPEFFLRAAQEM